MNNGQFCWGKMTLIPEFVNFIFITFSIFIQLFLLLILLCKCKIDIAVDHFFKNVNKETRPNRLINEQGDSGSYRSRSSIGTSVMSSSYGRTTPISTNLSSLRSPYNCTGSTRTSIKERTPGFGGSSPIKKDDKTVFKYPSESASIYYVLNLASLI